VIYLDNINAVNLRNRLHRVLDHYGMKLTYISNELGWKYHNLNKFKNGHVDMSLHRQRVLDEFLDKYDKQVV
jgi:hypothetical protein